MNKPIWWSLGAGAGVLTAVIPIAHLANCEPKIEPLSLEQFCEKFWPEAKDEGEFGYLKGGHHFLRIAVSGATPTVTTNSDYADTNIWAINNSARVFFDGSRYFVIRHGA